MTILETCLTDGEVANTWTNKVAKPCSLYPNICSKHAEINDTRRSWHCGVRHRSDGLLSILPEHVRELQQKWLWQVRVPEKPQRVVQKAQLFPPEQPPKASKEASTHTDHVCRPGKPHLPNSARSQKIRWVSATMLAMPCEMSNRWFFLSKEQLLVGNSLRNNWATGQI